jgi:hypothetical protein
VDRKSAKAVTQRKLRTNTDRVMFVQELWDRSNEWRQPWTSAWAMRFQFIFGQQWWRRDSDGFYEAVVKKQSHDRRETRNLLFNPLIVMVARETANDPRPRATPASSSEEDRNRARAAELILKSVWSASKMSSQNINYTLHRKVCGIGYMRVSVDFANESDAFPADASGEAGLRPYIDVIPPWEVFPQPGCSDVNKARWIIHSRIMHVDDVYEDFGKAVSPEPPRYEAHYGSFNNVRNVLHQDMVHVHELWMRPNAAHPDGLYIAVAGNELLEHGPLPAIGVPIVGVVNFERVGDPFGYTTTEDAIEVQRSININESILAEQRDTAAHGKWLAAKDSGFTPPTNAPAEVLTYLQGRVPPQFVQMPGPSESVVALGNRAREDLQAVLGVSDPAMGVAPASQSGRAFAFQAEEDAQKQAPSAKIQNEALKLVARKVLIAARTMSSDDYLREAVGPNNEHEIKAIKVSDIHIRDIDFEITQRLPLNRDARREVVVSMYQTGLISDPNEARSLLEFGDLAEAYGTDDLDRDRARHENDALMNGEAVVARPHEDHICHIDAHVRFMKQKEWYDAPEQIKQAFHAHVQQHVAALSGPSTQPPGAGGPMEPPSGPEVDTPELDIVEAGQGLPGNDALSQVPPTAAPTLEAAGMSNGAVS